MPKVAILLADGFETAEALTTADILRRAGIRTRLVSTMGTTHVITAQQVQIMADETFDALDQDQVDCFVIPGGTPGVKRLSADERVVQAIEQALGNPDKTVAAICAGPLLLSSRGLLRGRRVTAFPGLVADASAAALADDAVVVDGNLITARSLSAVLLFSLAVVEHLAGHDIARKVSASISGQTSRGCAR